MTWFKLKLVWSSETLKSLSLLWTRIEKQITVIKNFVNTRVYNLISFPQITLVFLLRDEIISSKTDARGGSKKEKWSYGNVRNNKTMSIIYLIIYSNSLF